MRFPVDIATTQLCAGERDGKCLVAGEPVRESCLAGGIEQSLVSIARCRKVIPKRCLFCRLSDYEPHTTLGSLRCYLGESAAYCAAAAETESNHDARHRIFFLHGDVVDDLGTCSAFEVRPINWGYRG